MRKIADRTITIKACRSRGGLIAWTYDNHRQCARFWATLKQTGCAPDSGEPLETAAYFQGDKQMEAWDKTEQSAPKTYRIAGVDFTA